MVKKAGIALILLALSTSLFAESTLRTDLDLITIVSRMLDTSDNAEYSLLTYGVGQIDIKSSGNRNLKAQLSLNILSADTTLLTIPRLFAKIRFPSFILTVGKAPVSWGEGFAFNAGDLIFPQTNLAEQLSSTEIRDNAAWLTELNYSLGPFAFSDLIIVFPEWNLSAAIMDPINSSTPLWKELKAGTRLYMSFDDFQFELGYITEPENEMHKLALSLNLFLGLNFYLSASISAPYRDIVLEEIQDTLNISAGVYQSFSLLDKNLSLRIESLILPANSWEENSVGDAYAIQLFPELNIQLSNYLSVQLRSIFSPIDLSALIMGSFHWSPIQGVSFYSNILGQVGTDNSDLYHFERDGGLIVQAGINIVY